MELACEIIAQDYDILGGYELDKGRPKMFASDDEVLREANALYLHSTQLKWLDVGTLHSALALFGGGCNSTGRPGFVQDRIGDPVTNDVAKGMILLKKWWIERISGSADAKNKCSVYSAQDRARIWEAFSADRHFNNDGSSSMDTYKTQLAAYRATKIAEYREVAKHALKQLFPDDAVLTPAQRQQVVAAIDAETVFGLFLTKIAAALDAAQGTSNGPAAME